MTVIIGFNYLASFLITGMAGDYMFLIINLCMLLPVLLPIVMNRARTNQKPFHSKTEASVLLLFSLQCGLVSLLCFPQALYLSITAVFTIIASKYRKPWMIILSHPIIFFVADQSRCLFLDETDECDWSISGYSDWINRIVTSEYSNVYSLLLFSALPIWSTLFYTSLTKKSSKIKTE